MFNATGITHLVAISGLHVTLFGVADRGAGAPAVGGAARGSQRACRARELCAALVGLAAAAAYALLAGFSVPAQRTLIMLAAWCLTRLLLRPPGAAPPLAVALFGVLLLDPLAPLARRLLAVVRGRGGADARRGGQLPGSAASPGACASCGARSGSWRWRCCR